MSGKKAGGARMLEEEEDSEGGKATYWTNNYTNAGDVSLSASSTPNSLCRLHGNRWLL